MPRRRPTAEEPSVQLATRIPKELRRRLRVYCIETGTQVRLGRRRCDRGEARSRERVTEAKVVELDPTGDTTMVHPLSDPTMRLFSICAAILTINMLLKATLIGVLRNMRGVHISPEDYRLLGRPVRPPDELIERTRRAHQNDVENILPFFGIGLLFALSGVSPTVAWWLIVVFTASRLLHTVFYLAALQPWRSLIYTVGALDLGGMAMLLLWGVSA